MFLPLKKVLMYNDCKEIIMETIVNIIQKLFIFEKEPQKIGLSQFKEPTVQEKKKTCSIKNKDIKLSDLMRRSI